MIPDYNQLFNAVVTGLLASNTLTRHPAQNGREIGKTAIKITNAIVKELYKAENKKK